MCIRDRVYEAIDGQLEIRYRDRVMRWTELSAPPAADLVTAPSVGRRAEGTRVVRIKPRVCDDHPWRRSVEQFRIDQQLAADRKAYTAVNP